MPGDWDDFSRWLEDNPLDDQESVTLDPAQHYEIARVPLTFDGTTFAVIYSIHETIPADIQPNLNLEPLLDTLGIHPKSQVDELLEGHIRPQPLPDGFARDKGTRGPYYGLDQLRSKLDGMRGGWGAIEAIYYVEDEYDDDGVYYVEFGDESV